MFYMEGQEYCSVGLDKQSLEPSLLFLNPEDDSRRPNCETDGDIGRRAAEVGSRASGHLDRAGQETAVSDWLAGLN